MVASLRASLLALLLAGSLVPIAGLGWLEYNALTDAEVDRRRADFESAALASALRADAAAEQGLDPLPAAATGAPAEDVVLVDASGAARNASGSLGAWPELRARAGDELAGVAELEQPGQGLRLVAWARAPSADALVVLVRPPLSPIAAPALPFALLAAFVALGVALILGFVVLRVIAPVGRLERATLRLARGEVHERVPVEGPTEVRSLAEAFNTMGGELARRRSEVERLLEERTRALIDREGDLESLRFTLAHEFREPMRALRWMADDLADQPLAPDARDAVRVLRRRIDEIDAVFRDLLRYEDVSRRPAPMERVSLDRVFDAALAHAEQTGPLDVERPDLPEIEGNADLLALAFTEVLRNAAQHARTSRAPPHVRVSLDLDDDGLVLHVDDRGPGIPPARWVDALQLFQRLRREGKGTGAGLPLARRALQRHGGDLTLGEAPGGGARVTMRLPLAPRAAEEPVGQPRAGRTF